MSKPTLDQAKHTLELLSQRDLSDDDLRFLHDGYLSDFLEGVRLSRRMCFPTRDELRVFLGLLPQEPTMIVDYAEPFEKGVEAGRYDRAVLDLYVGDLGIHTRIKPGRGIKKVKIKLIESLLGNIRFDQNEAEGMAGKRYRLASWEEVLAFGATFPKVQFRCQRGIFGKSYGSFGETFQPNLKGWDGKRVLDLTAGGIHCNPGTHFLYVER